MRIICSREIQGNIVQLIERQKLNNNKTRHYYVVETTEPDNFDNICFVNIKCALNLFNKLIHNEEVNNNVS